MSEQIGCHNNLKDNISLYISLTTMYVLPFPLSSHCTLTLILCMHFLTLLNIEIVKWRNKKCKFIQSNTIHISKHYYNSDSRKLKKRTPYYGNDGWVINEKFKLWLCVLGQPKFTMRETRFIFPIPRCEKFFNFWLRCDGKSEVRQSSMAKVNLESTESLKTTSCLHSFGSGLNNN